MTAVPAGRPGVATAAGATRVPNGTAAPAAAASPDPAAAGFAALLQALAAEAGAASATTMPAADGGEVEGDTAAADNQAQMPETPTAAVPPPAAPAIPPALLLPAALLLPPVLAAPRATAAGVLAAGAGVLAAGAGVLAAGAGDGQDAAPVARPGAAAGTPAADACKPWTAAPTDGASGPLRSTPAPAPAFDATLFGLRVRAGQGERRELHTPLDASLPAGLQAAGPAATATPATPSGASGASGASGVPVHQAALPSHPLDAAFAGDIAAEVRLMADGGLQQAELRLNPADLGPLRIALSISAQTADISFTAAHATTRDGIAQALPALRELLAGQGLQLGQAGFGAGGAGQQTFGRDAPRQDGARRSGASAVHGAGPAGPGAGAIRITVRRGQGMLDLYA